MMFTQLKQQSVSIMQRKNELLEQEKELKAHLQVLDENYKISLKYLAKEEILHKLNQNQIKKMDIKIKNDLIELRKMQETHKSQQSCM